MTEEDQGGNAAAKVQEAAENVQQVTKRRRRITGNQAEQISRRYFQALDAHDVDAAIALWAEGAHDNVRGQADVTGADGVRAFLGELFEAVPDERTQIVSTTAQDERCAVQWRMTGTFAGPGTLAGIEPTGHPIAIEGIDLFTVRDGQIQANEAFPDSISIPRQIGMMPPPGSAADKRLTGAFNAKTRFTSRMAGGGGGVGARGGGGGGGGRGAGARPRRRGGGRPRLPRPRAAGPPPGRARLGARPGPRGPGRPLLHPARRGGPRRPPPPADGDVQLRHRAGAREHPQARRARAGGGL